MLPSVETPRAGVRLVPARVVKADALRVSPWVSEAEREAARQAELEQALEAAYRSGVEDGRCRAEAEAAAAVPMLLRAIEDAGARLRKEMLERQQADVASVLTAALDVAEWVLGRQPSLDASSTLARLDAVLDEMLARSDHEVVLWVAPSLVDGVGDLLSTSKAKVLADPALSPGEARLEAGEAYADATFKSSLSRLREALELDVDLQAQARVSGA